MRPIVFVLLSVCTLLQGCANVQNKADPFESVNRKVYTFNRALDKAIVRPVARGYDYVVPKVIDDRVDSFFSNLDDITVVFNDLLQFKFRQAGSDASRFLLNSTFGVLGLFDVATHVGLEKHNEDFGQTLGHWGVGEGPYLMLPFLGPSTLRDAPALLVDNQTDMLNQIDKESDRYKVQGLKLINVRQRLLDADKLAEDAYDEYSFVRDAYLQRRVFLVNDGLVDSPVSQDSSGFDEEDEELYDELYEDDEGLEEEDTQP